MTEGISPRGTAPPPSPFDLHLKPTRQPMLWASIAYSLGVVAGTYLLHWPPLWIAGAVAFLTAGLFSLQKRNWLAAVLALGAFFLAGALHIQLRGLANPPDATLQPFADGQHEEITAHVTRVGNFPEDGPAENQ